MKRIIILLVLILFIAGCKDKVEIEIENGPVTDDNVLIRNAIKDYELSIRTLNSQLYLSTVTSDVKYETETAYCDEWKSKQECISSCKTPGLFESCEELCGENCSDYVDNKIMNEIANIDVSVLFNIKDIEIIDDTAKVSIELYSQDNKESSDLTLNLVKEASEWKVRRDWIGIS
jgi:PBP1b-binding outer membrane lipoprotein LpoB